MPSDYDKIRDDNILEYGKGTRHLSFLGRLYTDRTHFIFELLQNAEDAKASKVFFKLLEDRLEVFHDGRPFNEKDVRGICGVGEGTKAEDLTQIGKFGIGFKSVYAYTSTPEVHSGDESFKIESYVRPYAVDPRAVSNSWTTLFVFPFNAEGVNPDNACKEISMRLRTMSARTLLFLRKIKEVEYMLPDRTSGTYIRDEVTRGQARQITVIGQNNGEDEDEEWLIFERDVKIPSISEESSDSVPVEIGFRLKNNDKDQKEKIVKIKDSTLIVSFPTEKETHLGFLIQGPYKTTPSRDNIPKDDSWNKILVQETSHLIADTLPIIKNMELLTVSMFEALPIRMDDFPDNSMFYPIVTAVREALMTKDLIPTDDGSFISARNAKLASAEWLRKLLRDEQLRLLFKTESTLKWVHGLITDRGAMSDIWEYLRDRLHIDEVTPDSFARKVDLPFFKRQTDEWFKEFYKQLTGQKDLWKKGGTYPRDYPGALRSKPFIRLQDDRHVLPFRDDGSPNVYLSAGLNHGTSLQVVKIALTEQEEALRFLEELGIPELDIVAEVIEKIIPKYESIIPKGSYSPNPVPPEEHIHDIEKIKLAYKTDSQEKKQRLKEALQGAHIIFIEDPGTSGYPYRKPDKVYFPDESLKLYFSGETSVGFISTIYEESLYNVFRDIGVAKDIRVMKKTSDQRGNIRIGDCHGWHQRGLNGFDPDIKVEGLKNALNQPSSEKSVFIWNNIAIPNSECIRGTVEKASKSTYENSTKEQIVSDFGRLLLESSWLPGPDGELHKPADLLLEDLPETFRRDEKLADILEMKKDTVALLAEKLGVPTEDITFIRNHAEEFARWKESIADREAPVFPTRQVVNPERRKDKLKEHITHASGKEYEKRERSVRTTKGTIDAELWLRKNYTNDDGQLVCQICKKMPFKKRDDEHYIEAVEAFSKDDIPIEHEAQHIALCAECSARYKEFVKNDEKALSVLKSTLLNTDLLEIPLHLGELDTTIRFVETHYHDLKTILEEMG